VHDLHVTDEKIWQAQSIEDHVEDRMRVAQAALELVIGLVDGSAGSQYRQFHFVELLKKLRIRS
jgi:hypothetical protein